MRTLRSLPLVPLVFLLACQRPDLEAFRRTPAPVVVTLDLPADVPDRDMHAQEYAAALRAKLATRLEVVPAGVVAPSNADTLRVVITGYSPSSSRPSAGATGVATGVTVGVVSAAAGSRSAVWDGFWWGMFAGSLASESRHHEERLGFRPMRVEARVLMTRGDGKTVLADFDVSPHEIMKSMEPLRRSEEDDASRIAEVEAKALARVVVRELDEVLELRVKDPRWYRDPAAKEEKPAEAPKAPETKPEEPKSEAAPEKKDIE
jgi:hypothetical protein